VLHDVAAKANAATSIAMYFFILCLCYVC